MTHAAPHLGPRGFKARAPGLSGKERGAGPGLRRQSPALDAPLRPRYSLAASAPNPRPCPQASAAKQTRSGFLLCNPVPSKSGPNARRRWSATAEPKRQKPARCPAQAEAAQPGPARRSRECTSPRRTPCVAQSPHRASALIILVLSLLASQIPPKKSRVRPGKPETTFQKVSPYRYLIESSIG